MLVDREGNLSDGGSGYNVHADPAVISGRVNKDGRILILGCNAAFLNPWRDKVWTLGDVPGTALDLVDIRREASSRMKGQYVWKAIGRLGTCVQLTLCLRPQYLAGNHPELSLGQARFGETSGPGSKLRLYH